MMDGAQQQVSQTKAMLSILVGSILVFGTAIDRAISHASGNVQLAVVGGLVSTLASAVVVYANHHGKDTSKANPILAVFFLVWWSLGAGFLTHVQGVFSESNNGYFATWFTFFSALYFSFLVLPTMSGLWSNITGANGLAVLCIASCIEFAVAWDLCTQTRCTGSNAWAICCGLVSFFITLGHLVYAHCKPQTASNHAKAMAMFLFCWWTLGVIFITSSRGPFSNTNVANGYFSTWLAFAAAAYFCMMHVDRMRNIYNTFGGILGIPNFPPSNDYLHAHDAEIDPDLGFTDLVEEPIDQGQEDDGYTHFSQGGRSRSPSRPSATDTNGDGAVLMQQDENSGVDPTYADL